MKKKKLKQITNNDKYILEGLSREELEILKNNKDNLHEAIVKIGGIALLAKISNDYFESLPKPTVFPENHDADKAIPIDITPTPETVPTPVKILPNEELVKIIDFDETVNTFEKLELDNDLIDTVVTPELEPTVIDNETEEFLKSDDLLNDLNQEEADEAIINRETLDNDNFVYTDDDGDIVEDDKEEIEEFLKSDDLLTDLNNEESQDVIENKDYLSDLNDFKTDENGFLLEDDIEPQEDQEDNELPDNTNSDTNENLQLDNEGYLLEEEDAPASEDELNYLQIDDESEFNEELSLDDEGYILDEEQINIEDFNETTLLDEDETDFLEEDDDEN